MTAKSSKSKPPIKESDSRYRRIVEQASDVAYTADLEGNFTYVNPTAEILTGYSKDELIGMRFTQLILESWRDRVLQFYLDQSRDKVEETTLEFPMITKSGEEKWVEQKVALVTKNKEIAGFQSIVRDITERKIAEEELLASHHLLSAISRLQSKFIVESDTRLVFEELLNEMLALTVSEYGFIGEVLQTDDGQPYLKTWSITNIAWNKETRKFYDENAPTGMEFRNLDTLFGAVMKTGEPVIANDPAHDPRRGGLPDGHPPLESFLGIPLYRGETMVGMAGIANRPGGYDDKLLQFIDPLLSTTSNLIEAWRNKQRHEEATRALRESEMQIRAVLDNALDGIIVIDENGSIETFNHAAERMFGLTADEAVGQNVTLIMPEPHASEHNAYLQRYRDTGEARVIGIGREVEGLRKDGTTFPMELAVSELWLGNQRKFVGITHSLEEKKRLEDDRNQFFRLSLDMICIANFDGYFIQLNPVWERIMGYTIDELLAKPFIEFVHPDDREATMAQAARLAQGHEMISFENRYRTKEGNYKWFFWNGTASIERGLIFAMARDITDIKQSAEQLKHARDLAESATQAKSEFLAKMSHELRTPLNSVIGFTNILLKDKDRKLTESETTYLERILGNGKHLLELINDILDLSKVEAGKLELQLTTVALDEIIVSTLAQLEGQVQGTKIRLEAQIPEKIELLNTDKAKLKQVLINLVGNAIKFTEEGSVTVVVHTQPDTSQPERIEVQDTGIGIPPDRIATIFEAFQQVDSSTSRKFEGTGLGLAISHSLCELMGYDLSVESEPGVGSTFSIILPDGRRE